MSSAAARKGAADLQATEAELSVLGALLIEHEAFVRIKDLIDEQVFVRENHRRIFRAMTNVHRQGGVVDATSIAEELKLRGELDQAGGLPYLGEMLDAVPTAANIEHHARILADRAHRQRIKETAAHLDASASNPDAKVSEILADARNRLLSLEPWQNGRTPPADNPSRDEAWPTLRALLDRPELMEEPEVVFPRVAYRGHTTLVVGPDKSGKSTFFRHVVTAQTRGRAMLGESVTRGAAVWCGLEESLGGAVRGFHELDADPDRLRILALRPPSVLAAIDNLLAAHPADILVVDSLAEYARATLGRAPEDGDSSGWGAVIRPLVEVSRRHDVAVSLIHHARRSDGQYRGSGEIAAAVDCLWEMTTANQGEDPTLRRFRGRARWPVEDWSLRMEDGRYVLGAGGPLSLDARILTDVGENPGTSRSALHERVGGRRKTLWSTVDRLVSTAAVRDVKGSLYLPHDVSEDLL